MALIPVFVGVPGGAAISLLMVLLAVRGVLASITTCSWNAWIRDLVPRQILGRFFSKRLALAMMVAVVFSLGAGFFVDYWRANVPAESAVLGYTIAFLFGAIFLGMASPMFMSLVPEPMAQPVMEQQPSRYGKRLSHRSKIRISDS